MKKYNIIKSLFTFLFCSLLTFTASSQQENVDNLSFPQSWEGIWAGELSIYDKTGVKQTIPMELHIQPIDTSDNHTFWIIYGEDKDAGKRAYELVTIDADNGLYAIDEQNSIQMEAYLLDNQLIQRFEVMGNMLITINEKVDENTITWTIISGSTTPVSSTGKEEIEGEEIPEVKTYPLKIVQKAILKKI